MMLTLKKARLVHDYSQKEMADFMGLCEDSYRRIEKNPDLATVAQAKKISYILEMPYDQIFFAQKSS